MIDRISNYVSNVSGDSQGRDGSALELKKSLTEFRNNLSKLSEPEIIFFDSDNLKKIAHVISRMGLLSREAEKSKTHRATGSDILHILETPPNRQNTVSLLEAAEKYLKEPGNQELVSLFKEYHHNLLATQTLLNEISFIASEL